MFLQINVPQKIHQISPTTDRYHTKLTKALPVNVFANESYHIRLTKALLVNVFTPERCHMKLMRFLTVYDCTTGTYHMILFTAEWFCMKLTEVVSVNFHRGIQLLNIPLYEPVCLMSELWKQLDTNVPLWHGHTCPRF
jgi:hypothetical protein